MMQHIFRYCLECLTMRNQDEKRTLMVEINWLRKIAGISRLQKIKYEATRQFLSIESSKQLCYRRSRSTKTPMFWPGGENAR